MNGGSNLMQGAIRSLRLPGLRRLFSPRPASLLAAGAIVAAFGATGLSTLSATAAWGVSIIPFCT